MSKIKCSVVNCVEPGRRNFSFPSPKKDTDRFLRWISFAGNVNLLQVLPEKITRRFICGKHFAEGCFLGRGLRLDAVPTLHLPGPIDGTLYPYIRKDADELRPAVEANTTCTRTLAPNTNQIQEKPPQDWSRTGKQQLSTNRNVNFEIARTASTRLTQDDTRKTDKESQGSILQYFRERNTSLPKADKRLYNHICSLMKHVSQAKARKDSGRLRLDRAEKLMNDDLSSTLKDLRKVVRQFICRRLRSTGKNKFRRDFSQDDKILALLLCHRSTKTYKFLAKVFSLPSPSALREFVRGIDVRSGITDSIVEELKLSCLDAKKEEHTCCSLTFGQIFLSRTVQEFDDDGRPKSKKIVKYAGVWMLRGISKDTKWKRPIAYSFSSSLCSSEEIKSTFLNIARRVAETGLKIVSFVCDVAPGTVGAIRELVEESKRENHSQCDTENIIIVDGSVIVPLFNPLHLLRSFRNKFLANNLHFQLEDGQCRVAKWSDITNAVFIDHSFKSFNFLHKMTQDHLRPTGKTKMCISHCCQVFSRKVAAYIVQNSHNNGRSQCGTRTMRAAAKDTGYLVGFINDVFDSVNGGSPNCDSNSLRRFIPTGDGKCAQEAVWDSAIKTFSSMSFVPNASSEKRRPVVLDNWIFTLRNFKLLRRHLRVCKLDIFYPHFLNQDRMEILFHKIEQRCAKNVDFCRVFTDCYQMLICNKVYVSAVEYSNVQYYDFTSLLFPNIPLRSAGQWRSSKKLKAYFVSHMKSLLT